MKASAIFQAGTSPRRALAQTWHASRAWHVYILATGLLLVLQAAGPPVALTLRFDRAAIFAGQWWRLFTAHAVHLSWSHCALNVAGLWLVAAWCRAPLGAGRLFLYWAGLGGGISVLLLYATQVPDYVGLSGVLYGLFVLVLLPQALRRDVPAALALLAVLGWAAWQGLAGPSVVEQALIGGYIVTAAHGFGIVLATAWVLCVGLLRGAGSGEVMRAGPRKRSETVIGRLG
ncbi:rhombosortase [Bordetella sp. N]|uniref:rhombosortase n=1 Tax=Bordetella sp. N TaxID=1746199 RepID=UPI0009EA6EC7|nr:rhombosortase [Bordetella sp. N]